MNKHLLLLFLWCSAYCVEAQDLKLLTYNLADGIEGKRGNSNNFQQYMKQLDVDVAAFQDIDAMSETALQTWAAKWKHPYATILQSDAYSLAITSKYPLENIRKTISGMQHGYLYAEVEGVGIYTTQLTSESPAARKVEASLLAKDVATNSKESIVLLGTLNSYAPKDSVLYNQRFRRIPEENRYDREIVMRLASYQRKRNYEVLHLLQDVGLEDVLAKQRGMNTVIETTYTTDKAAPEYQQHRFDYILCNPKGAAQCEKIELLDAKGIRHFSEHYPVMASFKIGDSTTQTAQSKKASR